MLVRAAPDRFGYGQGGIAIAGTGEAAQRPALQLPLSGNTADLSSKTAFMSQKLRHISHLTYRENPNQYLMYQTQCPDIAAEIDRGGHSRRSVLLLDHTCFPYSNRMIR